MVLKNRSNEICTNEIRIRRELPVNFFWQIFYLLIIASFRIGVPSILFLYILPHAYLVKSDAAWAMYLPYLKSDIICECSLYYHIYLFIFIFTMQPKIEMDVINIAKEPNEVAVSTHFQNKRRHPFEYAIFCFFCLGILFFIICLILVCAGVLAIKFTWL